MIFLAKIPAHDADREGAGEELQQHRPARRRGDARSRRPHDLQLRRGQHGRRCQHRQRPDANPRRSLHPHRRVDAVRLRTFSTVTTPVTQGSIRPHERAPWWMTSLRRAMRKATAEGALPSGMARGAKLRGARAARPPTDPRLSLPPPRSRVPVSASRGDELPSRIVSKTVREPRYHTAGKFVSAGRRNQHARRARSPDELAEHPSPMLQSNP